jgi:hypothetical protein
MTSTSLGGTIMRKWMLYPLAKDNPELNLVGQENHHSISPANRVVYVQDHLLVPERRLSISVHNVAHHDGDTCIAQIQCLCPPLVSITNHCHGRAVQMFQVCVVVAINDCHQSSQGWLST